MTIKIPGGLNPLGFPGSGRKPQPKPLPLSLLNEEPGQPIDTRASRREEALAKGNEPSITVSLYGVRGYESRDYKVPFVEGQRLELYLSSVGLKMAAAKNHVRDLTHGELGRIRLNYEPLPDSHIQISHRDMSPVAHLQYNGRSDLMSSAFNMGRRPDGSVPDIVEFNMTYERRPAQRSEATKREEPGLFPGLSFSEIDSV